DILASAKSKNPTRKLMAMKRTFAIPGLGVFNAADTLEEFLAKLPRGSAVSLNGIALQDKKQTRVLADLALELFQFTFPILDVTEYAPTALVVAPIEAKKDVSESPVELETEEAVLSAIVALLNKHKSKVEKPGSRVTL